MPGRPRTLAVIDLPPRGLPRWRFSAHCLSKALPHGVYAFHTRCAFPVFPICFLVNTYTRMSLVIHVCLSLIHANTCFKLNIDAKKHTHSLTHTYVYIHTCLPFSPTLSTYRAHNGNKSKEILVSTLLFNFCVSVFLAAPLSIRLFSCIGLNSIKEGAAREE